MKFIQFLLLRINQMFYNFSEFNQVKLLGTIIAPVRTLPSGAKSLIVRTVDDAKR